MESDPSVFPNYDYAALANIVDFFVVMGYDERSQLYYKSCIAGPNSGLNNTMGGEKKHTLKFRTSVMCEKRGCIADIILLCMQLTFHEKLKVFN